MAVALFFKQWSCSYYVGVVENKDENIDIEQDIFVR